MKLVTIQIGKPQLVGTAGADDPMDREWVTAIFKDTVAGAIMADTLGLEGDGQADLRVHGGPDKAINAYPLDHYAGWMEELGIPLPHGAFGENLTTTGAVEEDVCIGDVFRCGGALLELSQPRQPCWKLARRWRVKDLAARVERTGRTGWYFRVLEPGAMEGDTDFTLVDRPYPQWSVAEANRIMRERPTEPRAARMLYSCPALAEGWKAGLGV